MTGGRRNTPQNTGKAKVDDPATKKWKPSNMEQGQGSGQAHATFTGAQREFLEKLNTFTVYPEKGVPRALVDHIPGLVHLFRRNGWEEFMACDGIIDVEAVKEFYATVAKTDRGNLCARVRGRRFIVTAEDINRLLGLETPERISDDFIDDYEAFLAHPDKERIMEARFMRPGFVFDASAPSATNLSVEAKVLHHVICHNFLPTQSVRKIIGRRIALVYSIMENHVINVGHLILKEIIYLKTSGLLRSLFYPIIITAMCHDNHVDVEDSYSGVTHEFQLKDLNRIHGYDSLAAARGVGGHEREEEMEEEPRHVADDEIPQGSRGPNSDAYPTTEMQTFMGNVNTFMGETRDRWVREDEERRSDRATMRQLQELLSRWGGVQQPPPANE